MGDGRLEDRMTEESGLPLQAHISVSDFKRSIHGQRQKERPVRGERNNIQDGI